MSEKVKEDVKHLLLPVKNNVVLLGSLQPSKISSGLFPESEIMEIGFKNCLHSTCCQDVVINYYHYVVKMLYSNPELLTMYISNFHPVLRCIYKK